MSAAVFVITLSVFAFAGNTPDSNAEALDMVWILIAAFLVFFMQAGFAMLETGFTRSKNAVNIMMKNLVDFSFGSLAFWAVGFALMFGAGNAFIGSEGFFLNGVTEPTQYAYWLFQAVFAATAATIVSGAVAGRIKFSSYLIYSVVITALIYPVSGHWIWGGGWLSSLETPMIDFAGSTVVHSLGGWAALAGAMIVGPRIGRYTKVKGPIRGHSLTLASLGVFILWFGWYGFNAGSTTSGTDLTIAIISVTTTLAASAGVVSAMITSWLREGKPDIGMSLNGALAGLVSITAGTANVSPLSAVLIGVIGGIIVNYSVALFDKLKIDDPVGAISVHGVCGAWGTLAVGLFAQESFGGVNGLFFGGGINQLLVQLLGVVAVFIWSFGLSTVMFLTLKRTMGIRVTEEEEILGLDLVEHGAEAYPDFTVTM
ncbi:MAG: ammonium transporter [Candidatus Marinimicrobia bacterium]|nr:ammonium transporter [Candidatus Neomarinimicrobiota bacterium]